MRHSTRRRNRSVESLLVEAVFTAVHDLCVRAIAGVVLAAQLALATAYVAATVVRCLAAAAWESVNADDRRALRQGAAAAVEAVPVGGKLVAQGGMLAAVAAYRWCEAAGAWGGDRVYQAMRREVARSQGWTREVPPPQDDAPVEDPWQDWQDEGAPVGTERMAA